MRGKVQTTNYCSLGFKVLVSISKGEIKMKKKAIKTISGEMLIGYILDNNDPKVNQLIHQGIRIEIDNSNAVFLKRDKHLTFLDKDSIESIRDAHPWEKETN